MLAVWKDDTLPNRSCEAMYCEVKYVCLCVVRKDQQYKHVFTQICHLITLSDRFGSSLRKAGWRTYRTPANPWTAFFDGHEIFRRRQRITSRSLKFDLGISAFLSPSPKNSKDFLIHWLASFGLWTLTNHALYFRFNNFLLQDHRLRTAKTHGRNDHYSQGTRYMFLVAVWSRSAKWCQVCTWLISRRWCGRRSSPLLVKMYRLCDIFIVRMPGTIIWWCSAAWDIKGCCKCRWAIRSELCPVLWSLDTQMVTWSIRNVESKQGGRRWADALVTKAKKHPSTTTSTSLGSCDFCAAEC